LNALNANCFEGAKQGSPTRDGKAVIIGQERRLSSSMAIDQTQ
jgi:hypothetical protein